MPTKSSTTSNRNRTNGAKTRKASEVAEATDTTTEVQNISEMFPVLDETPEFRSPPGRAKSPLRIAMEGLEVGQAIVADTLEALDSDDPTLNEEREAANKRKLAAIRGKAQEINKDKATAGRRFGVRVDVQDRVIVTRKPDADSE